MRYSIETSEVYEDAACDCCIGDYYNNYSVKKLSLTGQWEELEGAQFVGSIETAYELVIKDLSGEVEYDN